MAALVTSSRLMPPARMAWVSGGAKVKQQPRNSPEPSLVAASQTRAMRSRGGR
jgi:hypothetical protein